MYLNNPFKISLFNANTISFCQLRAYYNNYPPPQVPELSGSVLVQLVLRTLARFNFKGHDLLVFAREFVVAYLEDEDGSTRKDAAVCCCKLVANSFSVISSTQFSLSRINYASGKRRRRLVEEV
ncbi:hypothetical protein CQW23_04647 [Capsicum baccatum]|uniref:Uncharacterized protein n=1 Tax=Capsicum baccatum TaxID=33114 RepID=A0A2G2XFP6_CAPBA|nr:hypothetical protein CQW23_04647 [Capsicum baccatum]